MQTMEANKKAEEEKVENKEPINAIHKLDIQSIIKEKQRSLETKRKNRGVTNLVLNLIKSYRDIKEDYFPNNSAKNKKILTEPSEPVSNENKDNEEHFLIVREDDIIEGPKRKYKVVSLLGKGSSGEVFKVESDSEYYALKIIKNHKIHYAQAIQEAKYMKELNEKVSQKYFVKLYDTFEYYNHFCIVMEYFPWTLLDLINKSYRQGLTLESVKIITKEVLEAIECLHKSKYMHCDIKPENILINITDKGINIKITDFGSSCIIGSQCLKIIQTLYYKAPEVILGDFYNEEIDIWSLGCLFAELYLGQPLLPGIGILSQLKLIISMIGNIPQYMIKTGEFAPCFYYLNEHGQYVFKQTEVIQKDLSEEEKKILELYKIKSIEERLKLKTKEYSEEGIDLMVCFVHFLKGLLEIDPKLRWNSKQCLRAPFITGNKEDIRNFNVSDVSQMTHLPNSAVKGYNDKNQNHFYFSMYQNNPQMQMPQNMMQYNPYAISNNQRYIPPQYQPNFHYSFDTQNNIQNYSNRSNEVNNPNICKVNLSNIPFQNIINYPYAYIDPELLKNNNLQENKEQRFNNTFAETSYEQIKGGNEYYDNKYKQCYKPKYNNKAFNQCKFNNKSYQKNTSYGSNNYGNNFNNKIYGSQPSKIPQFSNKNYFPVRPFINTMNNMKNFNQSYNIPSQPHNQKYIKNPPYQNSNQSYGYIQTQNQNLGEYEGLMAKNINEDQKENQRRTKRIRSQSDYNKNNPNDA
ncbi:MAG: protein kinase [archaeon]|nr:protein kinase [archaeon]